MLLTLRSDAAYPLITDLADAHAESVVKEVAAHPYSGNTFPVRELKPMVGMMHMYSTKNFLGPSAVGYLGCFRHVVCSSLFDFPQIIMQAALPQLRVFISSKGEAMGPWSLPTAR